MTSKITQINLEDEMRKSYLDYAMSVIIGRALPDVRDGLKPVHRRVLYAMKVLGNDHTKAYKKPLPLRSLDTGAEEARIVWKKFVDEGYNRLSLARFDNPCHLNTLIDEDIEIIA